MQRVRRCTSAPWLFLELNHNCRSASNRLCCVDTCIDAREPDDHGNAPLPGPSLGTRNCNDLVFAAHPVTSSESTRHVLQYASRIQHSHHSDRNGLQAEAG